MTPERAKELIPILQAVADGKEVEYSGRDREEWHYAQYNILEEIIMDGCKLRVKSKPEIIPFDYGDNLIGLPVENKKVKFCRKMIIGQDESCVIMGGAVGNFRLPYSYLLTDYNKLNGSPCGKERAE